MPMSDYEAWRRFQRAIAKEAERLCRESCDCPPTAPCGAGNHKDWLRDAVQSLKRGKP